MSSSVAFTAATLPVRTSTALGDSSAMHGAAVAACSVGLHASQVRKSNRDDLPGSPADFVSQARSC
jgi:hypothetical protein